LDEEASAEQDYAALLPRSQFLRVGKTERANWEYDRLHELLKKRLRPLPDRGEACLRRVAEHQNSEVRIHAAAALLAVLL
jgi:hypothetical protein